MQNARQERRRIIAYGLREFGIDPIKMAKSLKRLPRFLFEFAKFYKLHGRDSYHFSPSLTDYADSAGIATGHYFWQDLITAKWIFGDSPEEHLDAGSRVDGFVAHLLSFREVKLLDIRPLDSEIPHLKVEVRDLMKPSEIQDQYDSVSSLHCLEHFGLGRYGDPLTSDGHVKGLLNLADYVKPNGKLYVSFPIGKAAIHFNSQRILDPKWAVELLENFTLNEFVLIPWKGSPIFGISPDEVDCNISGQAGLYKFTKKEMGK